MLKTECLDVVYVLISNLILFLQCFDACTPASDFVFLLVYNDPYILKSMPIYTFDTAFSIH